VAYSRAVPALTAVDEPPAGVRRRLKALRGALDGELPARDPAQLLIGTWNIRALGGLTPKWTTAAGDSPKRNLADVCCLAEIVRRFDVCAVQETRGELTALLTLLRRLGPSWGVIVTDAGQGHAANDERLAYVFDRDSVRPTGLAGELVIDETTFGTVAVPLMRQFARSPFMVSFEAGPEAAPTGFTLISLHVDYGRTAADRTPEIVTFANSLKRRAVDREDFNANLIALGDFNIDRWDDPNGRAFVSAGLTPPAELLDQPRSIFDAGSTRHFYDQIAWYTAGTREALTLRYTKRAGRIEWTRHLHRDLTTVSKSWRISDHYPLWAQFAL
jgi:endonuclease/exonuclease/phosphatase family metal-dependent hydrolase